MLCKNEVLLRGWIHEPFELHHVMDNTQIFKGVIKTKRQSGTEDFLPVHIAKRNLGRLGKLPEEGDFVEIKGSFISRNVYESDLKKHLQLYVQAKNIIYSDPETKPSENVINLSGMIIEHGEFRITTLGRYIIDFRLATLRHSGKRSCIPCIAWGMKTKFIEDSKRDDPVELVGRIQSRNYQRYEKGKNVTKTVYEVSVTEFIENNNV